MQDDVPLTEADRAVLKLCRKVIGIHCLICGIICLCGLFAWHFTMRSDFMRIVLHSIPWMPMWAFPFISMLPVILFFGSASRLSTLTTMRTKIKKDLRLGVKKSGEFTIQGSSKKFFGIYRTRGLDDRLKSREFYSPEALEHLNAVDYTPKTQIVLIAGRDRTGISPSRDVAADVSPTA